MTPIMRGAGAHAGRSPWTLPAWLAANFALRRPTVLIVDDLHWADEPSLRWLGYLARRLDGLSLFVVAATRPPEQARTPALVTEIVADPLAT